MNYEKIINNLDTKVFDKLTKTEVAKRMGIKPQSLNTILKNLKRGGVNLKTLERLAAAGEIKCEELLN
ncbi:helix-turn-helix domain-containing protein [Cetobacterium somerae]|uniref:helix-turn-helix domain-containing protein n=1 Tax=Cetobacterium somerae TaxID=188913 RepID=UPI00248EE12F|nr:helix-turn-helix domain-containing protein [Cetobacterium somerae]